MARELANIMYARAKARGRNEEYEYHPLGCGKCDTCVLCQPHIYSFTNDNITCSDCFNIIVAEWRIIRDASTKSFDAETDDIVTEMLAKLLNNDVALYIMEIVDDLCYRPRLINVSY